MFSLYLSSSTFFIFSSSVNCSISSSLFVYSSTTCQGKRLLKTNLPKDKITGNCAIHVQLKREVKMPIVSHCLYATHLCSCTESVFHPQKKIDAAVFQVSPTILFIKERHRTVCSLGRVYLKF